MVRLKAFCIYPVVEHIGCFNSTMVRLKENSKRNGEIGQTRFNSTMVRLKVRTFFSMLSPSYGFNSTMVRLKELCRQTTIQGERFQFHYGTIKSGVILLLMLRPLSVSIPLWYD